MNELNLKVSCKSVEYDFRVERYMTVEEFQQIVEFIVGVPINSQYYKNFSTNDKNATMEFLGIKNGDVLILTDPPVINIDDVESETIDLTSDATVTNANFRQLMEQTLGRSSKSFFYDGPFDLAFDASRRESKILMSVIFSSEDAKSIAFCRRIATNERLLKQFIANHFILWFGDMTNVENMQSLGRMIERNGMQDQLVPKQLPMTSFVAYFFQSISVLDIVEGQIGDDALESKFSHLIDTYEPMLVSEKFESKQKPKGDSLVDEQDLKYQESLRKDQEKLEKLEHEKKQKETEQRELEEKIKREKHEKETSIKQKQENLQEEPAEGEKETTTIAFRLLNGERVQRRFRLSDPIGNMFDFLELKHHVPSRYELLLNFPKKSYSNSRDVLIQSDSNLYPKAMLFVKELE